VRGEPRTQGGVELKSLAEKGPRAVVLLPLSGVARALEEDEVVEAEEAEEEDRQAEEQNCEW
jgi:hypothetical protein